MVSTVGLDGIVDGFADNSVVHAVLPKSDVLEISTMFGHGMIAFNLIESMVEEIKAGRKTPVAAANELACHWGIFNSLRVAQLLALISEGQAR